MFWSRQQPWKSSLKSLHESAVARLPIWLNYCIFHNSFIRILIIERQCGHSHREEHILHAYFEISAVVHPIHLHIKGFRFRPIMAKAGTL